VLFANVKLYLKRSSPTNGILLIVFYIYRASYYDCIYCLRSFYTHREDFFFFGNLIERYVNIVTNTNNTAILLQTKETKLFRTKPNERSKCTHV